MAKLFLLVAGVFLIPVALSYGVAPAATLPKFMNITVQGTDQPHIFRALGCLYLAMSTFCIIAAFTPEWRHVAVIWRLLACHWADYQPDRRRRAEPNASFLSCRGTCRGHLGLFVLSRARRKAEAQR